MIFPRLTVRENLMMGAYIRNDKEALANDEEHVYELFPILKERRKQAGGTLFRRRTADAGHRAGHYGQAKPAVVGRAVIGPCAIVVENIFEVIQEINRQGTTVMLVEQNAQMALSISHRGYVLATGQIILEGSSEELISNPQVRAAYLGLD